MAAPITPSIELSEQLLNDAAYFRADGRGWEAVTILLGFASVSWLMLRRVVEGDPRFAPALKRASKAAAKESEAVALRRLRAHAEKDDPKVSAKASEVLVEYAAEQLRNETKLKIARLRAEVQRGKLAARAGEEPAPREEAFAPVEQPTERAEASAAAADSCAPTSPLEGEVAGGSVSRGWGVRDESQSRNDVTRACYDPRAAYVAHPPPAIASNRDLPLKGGGQDKNAHVSLKSFKGGGQDSSALAQPTAIRRAAPLS